jgi:carbamoylphosphate synthase large subunit
MTRTLVWFNRTFNHVRGALELIRAGDAQGRFSTLCTHPNPHFTGFLAADDSEVEPTQLDAQAYVDWCLALCERRGVGIFYAGHHASAIAARQAGFEARGVRLVVAGNADALDALEDKAGFYASHAGDAVPGPETICVRSYEEYAAACATLRARHPMIAVKPSVGVYGIGFRVIDERRRALDHILKGIDYHVAATDLDRELQAAGTFAPLLVMEYLPGHEYSVDCLASQGELKVAIARRKEKGTAAGQVIVDSPAIQAACRALAARYGLNAIFNVQFKENAAGELRLLEVNARMSGGTAMACLAGPNLPYLAMKAALGELEDGDVPAIAYGLRVGEIQRAVVLS